MRELFPPEEMHERLRYTQLFMEHFRLRKGATKDFRHPLSTEVLYRIYKKMYPDANLSEADFELYFIILGAVNQSGSIFLDLRAQDIKEVNPALWDCINTLLTPEKYSLMTAKCASRIATDPTENGVIQFFDRFTRRRIKDVKSSVTQLYSLYTLYCIQNNIPILGNKRFVYMLAKYVGPVKKGYANGKSGVNYVCCDIPANQHWEQSLKIGIGVFEYLTKLFDNNGKLLKFDSNGNPEQLTQAHIIYRLSGGKYESTTTEEGSAEPEQEIGSDINGREDEGPITDVDGGQEESDAETSDDTDEGSYSGTKECEHEDESITTIAGSESTDDDYDEDSDDGNGDAADEGFDDELDYDNQEKPTLKEVFAALEIAYRINPGTFTKRVMNSYLVSMDVDYGAEDIWDDFMQFVGGKK